MVKTYRVKSPVKINVGLRVLSRRNDGFHNIETVFYPVKIYDEIYVNIEKLKDSVKQNIISVKTNSDTNITGKNNICYKAAGMFLHEFRIKDKYKIDIKIRKNIPIGAGLGGGSSNAVSVLKILAKHFEVIVRRNVTMLQKIGLVLGSDVLFFLTGKPAYATLRGEELTPLPKFKIKHKILIVNPGVHISTKWAYRELRIKNSKLRILNKIERFDIKNGRLMINDFERIVFKKYPVIEKIKYQMYRFGAVYSLMSGSGSTVYGLFTPQKIKAAKRYFSGLGYKTFIS